MPGVIAGRVVHVDDGDTLTILDADHFQRVIRLTDIDAPEGEHGAGRPGQPYSRRAAETLKDLTLGREAKAACYELDARSRDDGTVRERYVCRVFVDGRDINMALLDAGLAMANRLARRYVRDPATFKHEEAARGRRIGLWAQSSPVPPWDWHRACWQRQQCPSAGG
jgi:micrococcal nuclease